MEFEEWFKYNVESFAEPINPKALMKYAFEGGQRHQAASEAVVPLNDLLNARKIKAFDWLTANADELSIEWTGSHSHIYQGNAENLERLGIGRTLLEATEKAMGI